LLHSSFDVVHCREVFHVFVEFSDIAIFLLLQR